MSLLTQYWLEAGGSARIQAEEIMPAPRKVRQAFLQLLMSRKTMAADEAQAGLAKIVEELEGPDDLQVKSVIGDLNQELGLCFLEIKGVVVDGKEMYGIVNTVADPVSKVCATKFKDWERAFFKDIIKILCEQNNGGVDRQELVSHKVAVGGTFVSPKEKEHALFMWEAEHWLRRTRNNRVYLGTRTFLELGDIVRSHGMDLPQVLYF